MPLGVRFLPSPPRPPFYLRCVCLLLSRLHHARFITKKYTGRGLPDAAGGVSGGWRGGAHVTHTAYLTDGLARNHHRPPGSTVRSPQGASYTSRHTGFWGVWEPVLGRTGGGGGGGGGGGKRGSSTSVASAVPDGFRTTLSRRGGVFRLVPKQE